MENITKELDNLKEDVIESKEMKEKKERNVKVYKLYRIFSFDLLFYYAIIYLFLTTEKGLSAALILQFDAFYILFKSLLQIPSTLLIQKVGKRNSIVMANFIIVAHMLVIIFAPNFSWLLFSQFLCAFGFGIKATCETDLLYDSIPHGEKRGSTFAKIDGKSTSIHYYIGAISSVLAGFLFVINSYLPIIFCFLFLLFTAILSTQFESIHEKKEKFNIQKEIKNIRYSIKGIFQSKRLLSLLLLNALMIGVIKISQNLRNTVLLEIGMPEQYFGVIFAIMEIMSGFASRQQGLIHKIFKNRTLTFLMYPTVISLLILGFLLMINLDYQVIVTIVLILFTVQYMTKGPYYILIKRYLNNFTNSEKRVKIATANNIVENIIASLLIFVASFVTNILPLNLTLIILGCILTLMVVLLLDVMRNTVGLNPEKYSKKEIL